MQLSTSPESWSQLMQAQATGYGRQVGLMQFHTIVMHCLIADNERCEPEWLRGQDSAEVSAKGKRIPGGKGDKVIEDAPGSYVKAR